MNVWDYQINQTYAEHTRHDETSVQLWHSQNSSSDINVILAPPPTSIRDFVKVVLESSPVFIKVHLIKDAQSRLTEDDLFKVSTDANRLTSGRTGCELELNEVTGVEPWNWDWG